MKVSKFKILYPIPNRTTISKYIGKTGVYIIKRKSEIVYIGYSGSDLYRTITRHFQKWKDRQYRVTYPQTPNYTIRVILCSKAKAEKLERMLIIKHKPTDNENKYNSYKPSGLDETIINEYLGEVPF